MFQDGQAPINYSKRHAMNRSCSRQQCVGDSRQFRPYEILVEDETETSNENDGHFTG